MTAARPLLVLLTASFLASQGVSWADCCCGSFCEHKNTCTGCGPEEECPGAGAPSSCCDPEDSAPRKTCSHMEPSSEIERGAVDGPEFNLVAFRQPWSIDAVLPSPPPPPVPPPVDTGPPHPLHLDLSVLRI